MNKTMDKFLEDLHVAEFGYKYGEDEPIYAREDKGTMLKLLRRALSWKTLKNLQDVCVYLGAETDDRIDTVEGCKAIIREDVRYLEGHKYYLHFSFNNNGVVNDDY